MKLIVNETKAKTKFPKIMKAALQLFVHKGIDGTTIKDIASKAGVSEGALYRHFKSKEELAYHLFISHLSEFTTYLFEVVLSQTTAEKRIHTFISQCFEAFDADQDLFSYLIISEHRELKKFLEGQRHPGHLVLKVIQGGQRGGFIRKGDPYVLASLVLGGIIRTCVVRMYGGIQKDLRSYTQEVSDSLWCMLKKNE